MKKILGIISVSLSTAFVGVSNALAAPFLDERDCADGVTCSDDFRGTVVSYLNYFLGFLGLLAVVMIVYAGILLVTAQGEEEQVGKGKKIIMWAAIGLIVIMLSFAIVRVVVGAGDAAGGGA